MKVYLTVGTMLLACASLAAQSSPSPQTTGQSTGMPSGMHMGEEKMSQDMCPVKDHMAQMQDEMKQMKSRLERMRTDAEKVPDQNTKAALLDNVEMWEQFMSRMKSHMEIMNGAGGHHTGIMPEKKGMGHCKMDHSPQAGQSGAAPKQ
jgi:TolA-binding protein